MGRTMRIEVTAEDIANGSVAHCFDCPIAIAVKRATGHADLDVLGDRVDFWESDRCKSIAYLPFRARDWIRWFDDTGHASPFSFELELP